MLEGGGHLDSPFKLTKCNEEKRVGTLSSFGASEKRSYCWKMKNSDQAGGQDHSKLTELLQKMWGRDSKEQNWHMTSGTSWKSNCTKQNGGWVIFGEGDGRGEWLGYCDGSKNSGETSFIEVSQSNSKVSGIKLCEKDCWFDSAESQRVHGLSNRNENKWIELEFYKN